MFCRLVRCYLHPNQQPPWQKQEMSDVIGGQQEQVNDFLKLAGRRWTTCNLCLLTQWQENGKWNWIFIKGMHTLRRHPNTNWAISGSHWRRANCRCNIAEARSVRPSISGPINPSRCLKNSCFLESTNPRNSMRFSRIWEDILVARVSSCWALVWVRCVSCWENKACWWRNCCFRDDMLVSNTAWWLVGTWGGA